MRLILFDIDSTLLLTGGAGLEALRLVFRDAFQVKDAANEVAFHGRTDPMILRSIAERHLKRNLGDDELDKLRDAYLTHLQQILESGSTRFRVLEGARELVVRLAAEKDVVLGLATGNFEAAAQAKLRRAGLESFFRFGGYGSDSAERDELTRLALERGRVIAGKDADAIVVGDTVHDVRSAIAAEADCLAVATGNASIESLRAAGARWAVPSLRDPNVLGFLGVSA